MKQEKQVPQAVELSSAHLADLGCPGCSSLPDNPQGPRVPSVVELSSVHMADLGCPGCSSIPKITKQKAD